jgi:DNA repair exonuclease SbcCD ATPase subunit
MNIKALTLQNFKSYGNQPTRIEFSTTQGELILLVGENGAGKTSFVDALSLAWFNVVYGRNQKRIPVKELANRMNGNMRVSVEFETPGLAEGLLERRSNPSKVFLYEEGVQYEKAGKIQDRLQHHLGFDLESYRSFISMSINDFKNFIELSAEDKRLLLDKLFNMDALNQLAKVVKELKKENDRLQDTAGTTVAVTRREMANLRETIAKMAARHEDEAAHTVAGIRAEILANKDAYAALAERVQLARGEASAAEARVSSYVSKLHEVRHKRASIEEQLALYGSGKCPTCKSDLTTEVHAGYASQLQEKLEKLQALEAQGDRALARAREQHGSTAGAYRDVEGDYRALTVQLQTAKRRLAEESAKLQEQSESQEATAELEEMLRDMAQRQHDAEQSVAAAAKQDVVFKKLGQMFAEDGVKRAIVSNIVKPINAFIAENLATVGLPHRVILDQHFDARVLHMGSEVNTETLSTGEANMINICIMLAYIKLIRTQKHINMLFLDEVFASLSVNNVGTVQKLLRDFARAYNVNVFLVHHTELPDSSFDRIIKVQKTVFTHLEDTRPMGSPQ